MARTLIKQESFRKGIVASTLLNIGAKSVSFISSMLLVYVFGTNTTTDAYFLVISTLGFISSFLLGIINYIVIPEAMRMRKQEGVHEEQSYINFFFWIFSGIGIFFALVVLVAPVFFYSLFSKFSWEQLLANRQLLMYSCLLFPLNLVINLLLQVLSSHKYFTIPMIVALINNLINIVLLFVLKEHFGVTAAIIAYVVGFLVNAAWIIYSVVKRLHWNFFSIRMPSRKNWRNIILMEINLIPVSFRSYMTIFMLSGLGAGVITSYTYGNQIATIPEIMILSQVMSVISIKMNELSATDDYDAMDRLFQKAMRLMFWGLLPIGALMFLLSSEILQVLFIFKGKTDQGSIASIAFFFSCFAIIIPFRVFDLMITSLMTARQKIRESVIVSVILNLLIILLTYLIVKWYGLTGFYYLTIFAYAILLPCFYFFLTSKMLPFIRIGNWVKSTLFYFFTIAFTTVLLFYFKKYYLAHTGIVLTTFIISAIITLVVLLANRFSRYAVYSFDF